MSYDFANILFSGPCNRSCPFCIGKQLPNAVNLNNLNLFPLKNTEAFIQKVNTLGIRQIIFTGTISDPQLYKHQRELLDLLRERLTTDPVFSIHTNGVLTHRQVEIFNQYDKSCISFPSFFSNTYENLMGSSQVPDLERILRIAKIEVKVSCVVNKYNVHEIDEFLSRCADIGVRRVVVRKLFGETRSWPILPRKTPVGFYRENPVYDLYGMEVTYWDFRETTSTSINLFPNGVVGSSYLLTETLPLSLSAT